MAEEEATSLSVWAVACLCGSLRLEHVSQNISNIISHLLKFLLTFISKEELRIYGNCREFYLESSELSYLEN